MWQEFPGGRKQRIAGHVFTIMRRRLLSDVTSGDLLKFDANGEYVHQQMDGKYH
jgi:hypothetical protein